MANYSSTTLSVDELKTEFRDYKLKSLNGEVSFAPSESSIEKYKDTLYFISDKFPNDIISGSLALNIFGLISRDTNDIDIIIDDKDRYPKYHKDHYDDEFSSKNRLGFLEFRYKRGIFTSEKIYNVDFFHNSYGASFITFEFNDKQLKLHNPLEIIDYKLNMAIDPKISRSTSRKHNEDLTRIFGQTIWQLVLNGNLNI